MKILIIEDEKDLVRILKKGLEEHSFTVETAYEGEEGLYLAETFPYDAVVLDLMLPEIDGFSILERLRKSKKDVPVIVLTAKGGVEERVRGLNLGADDYIPKPFDFSELLARLRAVIRRHKGEASPVIEVSDLEIDMNSHRVRRAGREVQLTANEYKILEYLALHKGRVISRTELLEHIYDINSDPDSNVIDVYINYLRRKIDRDHDKKLIHTVRGAGYILKE